MGAVGVEPTLTFRSRIKSPVHNRSARRPLVGRVGVEPTLVFRPPIKSRKHSRYATSPFDFLSLGFRMVTFSCFLYTVTMTCILLVALGRFELTSLPFRKGALVHSSCRALVPGPGLEPG